MINSFQQGIQQNNLLGVIDIQADYLRYILHEDPLRVVELRDYFLGVEYSIITPLYQQVDIGGGIMVDDIHYDENESDTNTLVPGIKGLLDYLDNKFRRNDDDSIINNNYYITNKKNQFIASTNEYTMIKNVSQVVNHIKKYITYTENVFNNHINKTFYNKTIRNMIYHHENHLLYNKKYITNNNTTKRYNLILKNDEHIMRKTVNLTQNVSNNYPRYHQVYSNTSFTYVKYGYSKVEVDNMIANLQSQIDALGALIASYHP